METEPMVAFIGGRRPTVRRPDRQPDSQGRTVKEFAAAWGVTERTVWTWIRKEAVAVDRTPGGRVRIVDK